MFLAGSYQNPQVIETPGFIPPPLRTINVVRWGEDVSFTVADPGVDCTMVMIIRTHFDEEVPDLMQSYTRTFDNGDIIFLFGGADVRKLLMPGIYHFQVVKIVNLDDPPLEYLFLTQGSIEVQESMGSLFVPEGDGELVISDGALAPYITTKMMLVGSTAADLTFGFYRSPQAVLNIIGFTVVAQTPSDGADLVLSLIDEDDNVLVASIILPEGDTVAEIDVDAIELPAGTGVICKVVSTGDDTAAENVELTVKLQKQ